MKRRKFTRLAGLGLAAGFVPTLSLLDGCKSKSNTTPEEARAIAKDAYIYGFPIVDSYRIQYSYFVNKNDAEYKGAWNEVHSTARVFTPDDKTIQTPNSDTPYSMVGLDLRSEPIVITVPVIEKDRYFSAQLIDSYTFNFAYLGSRATGNGAGNFLIAGPGWKEDKPEGIEQIFKSETEMALVIFRTQLFRPDDIENVKKVQAGYKAQPLSEFLGKPAAPAAPAINFMKPLSAGDERVSPEFFNILNFVLQFCPTHSSEKLLMERFALLNIGAGKNFDVSAFPKEIQNAIRDGITDAWNVFKETMKDVISGKISGGDIFGTREYLNNNYTYRFLAAAMGIYGNSKEEAIYPSYHTDSGGEALIGKNNYTLRFVKDKYPPVNAFGSLTLYEMPASLLYANSLNRYLINSPMLPNLKKDADGGLTFYIQHESPGKDKEKNWLPAPMGSFFIALRLYWPRKEALDGTWKEPSLEKRS